MEAIGWQQRAAGWFTWQLAPGFIGVLALSAASQHAAPGSAWIAPHLGLRHDRVERHVAELTGHKDESYRARTATCALGYVTPEVTYRQWLVDSTTAEGVAEEIAARVREYGMPYLRRLASDPSLLLAEAQRHPGSRTSLGICRVAVLAALVGEVTTAQELVRSTQAKLDETGPGTYADDVGRMLEALSRWLSHQA